jgi:conjugal transfer/type IV secretion protein DotA/TraY
MQKVPNYMIVLLTVAALFALAPIDTAMAASGGGAPSASSLFGMTTPDAPIQWIQNAIQGNTAPNGGAEPFLGAYGIKDNNGAGLIQAGLIAILSYYSYAMLVIGSFLLLYYLVRIIAETAHTGRPGGRANQLWAPIRTVLAIGMLIPLSTGLNSGQMIVLNLASEGSALASNTWTVFLGALSGNLVNSTTNVLNQPSGGTQSQAVYNYFLIQVCTQAYDQILTNANFANAIQAAGLPSNPNDYTINAVSTDMKTGGAQADSPADMSYPDTWVTTYGNSWNQALCGQTQTESPEAVTIVVGSELASGMNDSVRQLSGAVINQANLAWSQNVPSSLW